MLHSASIKHIYFTFRVELFGTSCLTVQHFIKWFGIKHIYKTSTCFISTRYHVYTKTVIFKQFLASFAKIWVTSFMNILCRSKKITILWALVCNNMDVMCSKTGWKGIFGLRLWFFDKLTVDGVGGCLTIGTQLKILALLMEIRSYWVYSYLWKNRLA